MFLQALKSKTVWLNLITAILAILAVPEVSTLIPPEWFKYIAAINIIGNIILRVFFTTQPIAEK